MVAGDTREVNPITRPVSTEQRCNVSVTNLHYGYKAWLLEDSKSKKGKKYKKRWGSKIKFSWCDSTGDERAVKK